MNNISAVTTFVLAWYVELESLKYVYFTVFLLLYIITVFANIVIITVIFTQRSLHEPMYIFVCNLTINGIYGSTSILPSLLGQLMSHSHEISIESCLTQIYFIHTYSIVEFSVLAVMSYDRYVAICHPLHYHVRMSSRKVCFLISISWIYPLVSFGLYFMLTVKLTFCSRIIHKAYCLNFEVVRLSCSDITMHSIVGLIATVFFDFPQLAMIAFSYVQILRICMKASKGSRMKAFQTCIPHLIAAFNYTVGCSFEVIQSRLNMSLPLEARVFMSVVFLTFTPLLNTLIYGMSLQNMRVHVFRLIKITK